MEPTEDQQRFIDETSKAFELLRRVSRLLNAWMDAKIASGEGLTTAQREWASSILAQLRENNSQLGTHLSDFKESVELD